MNLTQYMKIPAGWRPPLMVADGIGVDSTAMEVLLHQLGIVPDAILHADVGGGGAGEFGEHPETIEYREYRRAWLKKIGFPDLTIVKRAPPAPRVRKDGTPGKPRARRDGRTDVTYATLAENCIENATLPSMAFGGHACSAKWKLEPQNAWTEAWEPAIHAWATGRRVVKLIGYDAGPADMRRAHNLPSDHRYCYIYPLRDAGWDRARSIAEIRAAGVKVPRKSACIFCSSAKPWEIAELTRDHPDQADFIIEMERVAAPRLRKIDGLWRKPTKGMRGAIAKPGSMSEFIQTIRRDPAEMRRHLAMAPSYEIGGCGL